MGLFSKKEKPEEKQTEKDTYKAYLERCAQSEAREVRLAKMHIAESKKNRK